MTDYAEQLRIWLESDHCDANFAMRTALRGLLDRHDRLVAALKAIETGDLSAYVMRKVAREALK